MKTIDDLKEFLHDMGIKYTTINEKTIKVDNTVFSERKNTLFAKNNLLDIKFNKIKFNTTDQLHLFDDKIEVGIIMKLSRAIEILEAHNKWRRRDDDMPQTFEELGHTAEDIGVAIDTVVKYVKDSQHLLGKLAFLNGCEMEGISTGMPTSEQWQKTFEEVELMVEAEPLTYDMFFGGDKND